ncbi:flagellin [Aliarcobacter butzleri]|uniref:flagellin n=1 Tax=Aliarcobacter butzleri TaxID=28197 RepID=UPI002B245C1C|nr:flagellin [Aliarcobacter butzleri]
MRINTNVSSLTAQEAAVNTNKNISSSLEKLSTGLRINKAADDASGLAIADKLRTQATSINQGISNGNSAVALLQITDKSMAEQSTILDTIKSKLIQANTDTTSVAGRTAIAKDITKLLQQLNNIGEQTNYNGTNLLQNARTTANASTEGNLTAARTALGGLSFQIGEGTQDLIKTKTINSNVAGLKLSALAKAISILNGYRGDIGSTQNQVESAIRNLTTQATNIKNAESTIRDVDYAQESANYNKLNIIAQAGSYAISQANSTQQNVLRLLQ